MMINYRALVGITCEKFEVRTLHWGDAMTDHTLAQATLPIAARRARPGDTIPKLARADSKVSSEAYRPGAGITA